LGCKLAILIEELLCVFTDSQMKAALHYIDSLAGVVKKSTDLSRKKKAIRKLEVNNQFNICNFYNYILHNNVCI